MTYKVIGAIFWVLLVYFFVFLNSLPWSFSTSSYALYVGVFLITGFVFGTVAVVPLFLVIRSLSGGFAKKLGILVTAILFVLPVFSLLSNGGLLITGFTSFPVPPSAIDSSYVYRREISFYGFESASRFRFSFDPNLSFEERLKRMEQTTSFYEDFAQDRGLKLQATTPVEASAGLVIKSLSCTDAIEKEYRKYKEVLRSGDSFQKETYERFGFRVSCFFGLDNSRYYLPLDLSEGGGSILLD